MKLALGTVQFGLDYSISNTAGQVSVDEVSKILDFARSVNLDTLDTAQAYGSAEQVLGSLAQTRHFKLISKISQANSLPDKLRPSIEQSLQTLKLDVLDGILLHDADILLQPQGSVVYDQLTQAKHAGLVKKIGVSVYHPQQLIELCQRFSLDMVQLPLNLFDQRFLADEVQAVINQQQLEVHCRSAFLQGIIFCQPHSLPPFFDSLKPSLRLLQQQANELNVSPITLCLALLKSQSNIAKIVIGCCSEAQLKQTVEAYHQIDNTDNSSAIDFDAFAVTDDTVINPANWPAIKGGSL